MCKKTGGSDNRSNIISIPQPGKNVNKDFVIKYKICTLQKEKLFGLYNIPSCIFCVQCYNKHTKR